VKIKKKKTENKSEERNKNIVIKIAQNKREN
jgi:hypothetical protein